MQEQERNNIMYLSPKDPCSVLVEHTVKVVSVESQHKPLHQVGLVAGWG